MYKGEGHWRECQCQAIKCVESYMYKGEGHWRECQCQAMKCVES